MNRRDLTLYIAAGFAVGILLLSGYFFAKRPDRTVARPIEKTDRVIVFRDVKYAGEKKGAVDWELNAKLARKYIDKPFIELEDIEGLYKPKPDTVVLFTGTKGEMDTEAEIGSVDDVEIVYKDEYRLKSKHMDFDFKNSKVTSSAPVDLKGKRLTLLGQGLVADTKEQVIRINRDVSGTVDTEERLYKFWSDRFVYRIKEDLYTFERNVRVKGEDMELLCDTLHVLSKDDKVDRIDALGNVRLSSKGTLAKSGRAVYYLKEDKVTLEDSPRIIRDKAEMKGQQIVYNLSTGKFSVIGPRMRIER
jgi:LPS export ABC transporter protein LptC/lipopolysaccharide transport protein LptA